MLTTTVKEFEEALAKGNLIDVRNSLIFVPKTKVAEVEINIPVILIEKINIHTKERLKYLKVDYENATRTKRKLFAGLHKRFEALIPVHSSGRRRQAVYRMVIA